MNAKGLGQQPAFPLFGPNADVVANNKGMTLRQYIAIEMMKALVTHGEVPNDQNEVAKAAIDYTRALLQRLVEEE